MIDTSRIVGLTGPMGAGKSTVSALFHQAGIAIVDYDQLVQTMYENEQFRADLGSEWDMEPSQVVKSQIAAMITQYPERLARLEEISKPWLDRLINEAIADALKSNAFVVFDCPLLYEGGWDEMCEYVILVTASEKVRRERIMARPGMTHSRMLILMDRQLKADDELRREEAGWVINTDNSMATTVQDASRVAERLWSFYK